MNVRLDKKPPTIFTRTKAYKFATMLTKDDDDGWIYKVVYTRSGAIIECYDENDKYIGAF